MVRRVGAPWAAALALACAATALPAAAQVPPPSYASFFDRLPCVQRIGRCFDATIGGAPVEVIADQAEFEKLKTLLQTLNRNVRDVHWIVRQPVAGSLALEVETRANAFGLPHVGDEKEEPDVTVYALDGQDLESKPELVADQSVRVNGQAVVTQQETLTQDFLPPGRYAFAIKFLGQKNWDRKWVFLTVAK
ncbi:hypothetical protein [Acidovorax sp.]|uniref:hypothetical protein n=1 Tax=Acidovorax sp. TaxID=1872122 RepID=UPI0025BC5058|nr:hypothetical protein [Acidovorax sp.]MCI5067390.1 hypothetical protein [Acidovorax sp.]